MPEIGELARTKRFTVTELAVPGLPGAPDVGLLICEPAGVPGPRPTPYYSFGGGMFSGDHRHRENVDPLLDAAEQIGVTVGRGRSGRAGAGRARSHRRPGGPARISRAACEARHSWIERLLAG